MLRSTSCHIETVSSFLHEIGLRCEFVPGATGFTPGLLIRDGGLEIDPELGRLSNVLHEAGHFRARGLPPYPQLLRWLQL